MATDRAACGLPQMPGSNRCIDCRIRHRAFCAALAPGELRALEEVVEDITLSPDRTVFYERDAAEHIYNVFSGTMKIYKLLQDGRRQVLGFPSEGDLLGLALDEEYSYSAETLTPVTLCRVSRARLRGLATEFPALETKLLQITAAELAESQAQMMVLGRKSAQERIASFLLQLSEKSQRAGGTGNPLTLPMSRHDIADYVGLTAETVSRVLTQFAREGLITIPQPYEVGLERIAGIRRLAEAE